jgi:hypothetical protein
VTLDFDGGVAKGAVKDVQVTNRLSVRIVLHISMHGNKRNLGKEVVVIILDIVPLCYTICRFMRLVTISFIFMEIPKTTRKVFSSINCDVSRFHTLSK